MKDKISLITIIILLFVGQNVTSTIGIEYRKVEILTCFVSIFITFFRAYYRHNKKYKILLIYLLLYALYRQLFANFEGSLSAVLLWLGPITVFSLLPNEIDIKNRKVWIKIASAVKLFMILEISIAIAERIFGFHLFTCDLISVTSYSSEFRSIALHGHPLQNALIVSSFMTFVLLSSLKLKYKYVIWSLGFIAVLCFNTRSSIVINVIVLLLYVLHLLFRHNLTFSLKIKYIFTLMIMGLAGLYLVLHTSFGGRLMEMGVFDDQSAMVRVRTLDIFSYCDWRFFLSGHDANEYQTLLFTMGQLNFENFWLDWVFFNGLPFFLGFVILFFRFLKEEFKGYTRTHAFFVCFSFLIIASTNNSLSSSYIYLAIFLLFVKLFNPSIFNKIISNKYIENH